MTHTERRWHVVQNKHPSTDGQPWGAVEAKLHPMGGSGQYPTGMTITWKGYDGKATAQFIVTAVNSHDGLMEALGHLIEFADRTGQGNAKQVEVARAAIKAARP